MDKKTVRTLWDSVMNGIERGDNSDYRTDDNYISSIDIITDIRAEYSHVIEDSRLYAYAVGSVN